MRNVSVLLLMVTMTTALEMMDRGHQATNKHEKRELLLRSKRRWVLSTIELVEEDPGPFPKVATQMFNSKIVAAKDHRFQIRGMGVDEDPKDVFKIDEETGVVFVLKPINREDHEFFHIKFDIFHKETGMAKDTTLSFDVAVHDINDNAPFFKPNLVTAILPENSTQGYLPVTLHAFDLDQKNTENSTVSITVVSQEPKEPKFVVEQFSNYSKTGHLRMTGCFDYDKAKKYTILVEAKDHGKPTLSSTGTIILDIIDSNTHAPVFKQKQHNAQIMEMETNKEVLRIAVEDRDTPGTPGWRAKYFFIKGNEEGNYKIETDPKTNEGILTVVKGRDYERTRDTGVQIGVKNEEELFKCATTRGANPPHDSVNITIKVIDINDPPEFEQKEAKVFLKEEDEPGKVLYTPKVSDVDSDESKIRFVLVEDPADWVTIDEKTGQVKSEKKMDRESPFVDTDNIYKIKIAAIDNGEPPATATCTVFIHLGDINDNLPKLVNDSLIMCGNKVNKVIVLAEDKDAPPYSGPFTFFLGGTDKTLKQSWKLDPSTGDAAGLISIKTLPYGNYSVPLVIQDQQGVVAPEAVLMVKVCDCGGGEVCLGQLPLKADLGAPGIGMIFVGLLLFLLLLLLFMCECGGKKFQHIPIMQDEGNQTLIKYNEEGGGSACKAEPTLILSPTSTTTVTDGLRHTSMAMPQMAPMMITTQENTETYRSSGGNMFSTQMSSMNRQERPQRQRSADAMGTVMSLGGRGMYSTWNNRMTTSRNASMQRSFSLQPDQNLADHIERRLYVIGQDHAKYPTYQPYEYADEGQGSKCQSLDELSLSNPGDDLEFLNDLGSKFKTLGSICHQDMQERRMLDRV